ADLQRSQRQHHQRRSDEQDSKLEAQCDDLSDHVERSTAGSTKPPRGRLSCADTSLLLVPAWKPPSASQTMVVHLMGRDQSACLSGGSKACLTVRRHRRAAAEPLPGELLQWPLRHLSWQGMAYLGDYVRLVALCSDFYGVFSGSNLPERASFPNDVIHQ